MSISQYIKEIGRGKDGARPLAREQATDLMGQVLDGQVTDLEIGAFCLAMRIKGETPEEMAGFLDAVHARLNLQPAASTPTIVLPSYNGARKLPLLTPLLGLLLARSGLNVLIHGTPTESRRVFITEVLDKLNIPLQYENQADAGVFTTGYALKNIANDQNKALTGSLRFVRTEVLCPALKRLLDVRRVVGLRNPAHSLVKLMTPCQGQALVVSSYTHPEYAISMAQTLALTATSALLLRGTEGEAVADARRMPQMDGFIHGERRLLQAAQGGSLVSLPDVPKTPDAQSTADYIEAVLAGQQAVPAPIAQQVEHILHLVLQL